MVALQDTVSARMLLNSRMATAKSGEWIGMDGIDTNGVPYHIDFVKE